MRRKTPEEVAWLAERYPTTPNAELLEAFRAEFGWAPSTASFVSWASSLGLGKARRAVRWSEHPEYGEFLRSAIPGRTEREIADAFEREFGIRLTRAQVKNAKARLGARSGTHGGRFEPGHVPANKGRTWDEMGIPEEIRERMRATQFKPKQIPHNARDLPIGSERLGKCGYIEVKVREHSPVPCSNKCWVMKQRLVWEEANGRRLKPGEVVLFCDGDRTNLDPENLVAVTQAENIGLYRIGRPYADRETLMDALKIVRLQSEIAKAEMRPRRCRACGEEFVPRFKRQRRCDRCLGRE